jgi:hypothetical protein
MFDYTEDGYRARQADISVAYLNLIDTKLSKINRKLGLLTVIAAGAFIMKNKKVIKKFINVKGE